MAQPIGIDLGTTRSVVATLEGGRPVAIPNGEGRLVTPSVVAFTPSGRLLVGQRAKRQAAANPELTVASVKRFMGSEHRFRIGAREYLPQEIAAHILRRLKEDAEAHLGEPAEGAVVSVPAYFNDRQRAATREAAHLAELKVLRLISEPTAAALAYGLEHEEVETVLVWDLGGGTFDVSLMELGEGIFEARAVSGDNALGGDDFDQRIMDYLAAEYRQRWGSDFPGDGRSRERLREAAERAKVRLSFCPETRVYLPFVERAPVPRHLDVTLTQERMERLVADLLKRLIAPTRQVLADAGLTPRQVERVILVGKGSKMPAVLRLATELLGQEPYRYLDPELVTALGAAVQAGMLVGQIEKAVLLDVLPLSLGVETQGGLFARVIPRNTPLPAAASQLFTNAADSQVSLDINVLQGERELANDNVLLGQLELEGLPSGPTGTAKVEVAFEVDVDGEVGVSAEELMSERQALARFVAAKRLAPWEIEQRVHEAQALAEQDKERRGEIQAGIEADNAIAAAEMALEELADRQEDERLGAVVEAVDHVRQALVSGPVSQISRSCARLRGVLAKLGKGRSESGL